jgi:polysaccharide pyruvyl transferase WcaK-like protein
MDAIDVRYAMDALGLPAARILPLSMSGFDEALAQPSVCIGVRLHAGIRALQRGRQAVIVAIDNRAREMVRDFALPVVEYDATTRVPQWLDDAPSGDIMTGEQRAAVSVFMDALAQMVAG